MSAVDDLELFADAVEALAFKMPPPNEWTPQFVQLAQSAKRIVIEHREQHHRQYKKMLNSVAAALDRPRF